MKIKSKRRFLTPEAVLYLTAFAVPFALMLIIFAARGIWPFGDECFLRIDMYHQYAPFMQEFSDKLKTGGSLLYSWDIGGGVNFAGYYAYYLASPLNWLILLVPKIHTLEFMGFMVLLKTGLASAAFTWYLSRHTGTHSFAAVAFGIFYAMSGYMAAYSWNVMWLDCIVLMPLILLGIEKLVHEGDGLLYTISLGLCILSNYYISIMVCIFLVLYFIALVLSEDPFRPGRLPGQILRFSVCSLLAGAFSAIVLLPEIFALQATASASSTFPTTVTSYFTMIQMLSRHLMLVESETGLDHWPNIYCGVAVFAFVPMYVLNRRYSYKEKIANFLLILFFLASFSLNVLNYIWHGLHYPNSLPCRQSFLYIAMILTMSYKGFLGIRDRSVKQVVACFAGAIGFVILAEQLADEADFSWYVFYLSIVFLAAYGILAYLYRKRKVYLPYLLVLMIAVCSVEASVNMIVTSCTTVNRTAYLKQLRIVDDLTALMDDTGFYRTEHLNRTTKNDGAWLGYSSASTFSSTSSAAISTFYKKLGMEASTNAYATDGATPLAFGLLGVRYLFATSDVENPLLTKVAAEATSDTSSLYLYEMNSTLSVGYVLSDVQAACIDFSLYSPIKVQNSITQAVVGKDVLNSITSSASGKSVSATVETSGLYYVYVSNTSVEDVTATHGSWSKSYDHVNRGYLLDLGWCESGETIVVSTTDDASISADIARFDTDVYEEFCNALSDEQLVVTEAEDTKIAGTLDTEGGLLVTSIPYDPGWTLKVDGVEVTTTKWQDAYIAFEIGAGEHTIEFTYMPSGLIPGAAATLVVVVIFGVWIWFRMTKRTLRDLPLVGRILRDLDDADEYLDEESETLDGAGEDPDSASSSSFAEEVSPEEPAGEEPAGDDSVGDDPVGEDPVREDPEKADKAADEEN